MKRRRLRVRAVGVLAWVVLAGGCVPAVPYDGTDENVGVDPAAYPGERVRGEPNNTFDEALTVVLDAGGRGRLRGTITGPSDVDVYAFKSLAAGDRLIIDVGSSGGELDAAVAVYDEAGRILFENDDRNLSPPQLDPFLNQVLRRESRVYYLAVYRSPLSNERRHGPYEVLISTVLGGEVPAGQGQRVVLNFEGGTIALAHETYTVGRFDAGAISPAYAGTTAAVRDGVAATVRENYEGLSLDVRVLPGDARPTGVSYSTVLFGGVSRDSYGEAQTIDTYNANPSDEAIVFTGMFTPARFGRVLTVAELGTAIGNVASHELGHLLGLNHVADVRDVMDTTGSSVTLLEDVAFLDSPLDWTIAPLGTQDSFLLLLETLGAWGE